MKVALSKKDIRILVYTNLDAELGLNHIQFSKDLNKLFR